MPKVSKERSSYRSSVGLIQLVVRCQCVQLPAAAATKSDTTTDVFLTIAAAAAAHWRSLPWISCIIGILVNDIQWRRFAIPVLIGHLIHKKPSCRYRTAESATSQQTSDYLSIISDCCYSISICFRDIGSKRIVVMT